MMYLFSQPVAQFIFAFWGYYTLLNRLDSMTIYIKIIQGVYRTYNPFHIELMAPIFC